MNKTLIAALIGWLLLGGAALFYGYGLYEAISVTLQPDLTEAGKVKQIPEVLSTTLGAINALLLTNLGIVLGISIAKPGSSMARAVLFNASKTSELKALEVEDPIKLAAQLQLLAVIIYVLALVLCLIIWIIKGFSLNPQNVISTVSESGKMFIGVVLAYLTVVLGIKNV